MLPYIKNIPAQSSIILDRFRGINQTPSYEMGELCSSLNIDSDHYPAIGTRKKRKKFGECDGIVNGIGSYDGMFYTYCNAEQTAIYLCYNGSDYEFTGYSKSDDFSAKRYFADAGGAILIIPDRILFNTTDLTFSNIYISQYADYRSANAKFKSESSSNGYSADSGNTVGNVRHNRIFAKKYTYVPGSSTKYEFYTISFSEDIKAGDMLFIKMTIYSDRSDDSSTYNTCKSNWEKGMWVKVKNIVKQTHSLSSGRRITDVTELQFEDNSIDVAGLTDMELKEITIERHMPDLDRIISYNNRVWAIGGDKVYTSRLGDADEWNDFSVDSYGTLPSSCFSASAGTPGDFTAICQHGSYIYAFKENYIHKIYGDTPDEYSFSNLRAPGCIKNADTISVCGNYLIYASGEGICILRDGYPKIISKKIGKITPVCAASHNSKYYLICDKDGGRVIFVYDLEHDIWTMESCSDSADNIHSDARSIVYSEGGRLIYLSDDDGDNAEETPSWNFRLRFDRNAFERNTSVRAVARVDLGEGAELSVKTVYDDGTEGRVCQADYDSFPHGRMTLRLPIKRDLGFYLDFSGSGDFEMRSIKFNYYKSFEE